MPEGISFVKPTLELQFSFDEVMSPIIQSEKGVGPFSEAIELALYEAVSVLAKLIVDETPVNLGHLSGAISQSKEVWYGDQVWYGQVSDGGIQYAEPVEFGYGPFPGGKGPSKKMVDSMELWIVRKQLKWYRSLRSGGSVPMTSRQMAWALSWHFAKHGNEGAHMFEKGIKAAIPHVDKIWSMLMDELQVIWGSTGGYD